MKRDFRQHFDDVDEADAYYAARQSIAWFIDGQKSGYVNNRLPAPGARMEVIKIDHDIHQIDYEWNKELSRSRGKAYQEMSLEDTLSDTAKLALIHDVHNIMRGKLHNRGTWDQED